MDRPAPSKDRPVPTMETLKSRWVRLSMQRFFNPKPRPPPPLPEFVRGFSTSSLSAALDVRPPPLLTRWTRTSPPPHYDPYPYQRTWEFGSQLTEREQKLYNAREDNWLTTSDGYPNEELRPRFWHSLTAGIRERQRKAKKAFEEERLLEQAPPVPMRGTPPPELEHIEVSEEDLVDHRFDLEFRTVDGEEGVPVKSLLMGRRAIERAMEDAKGKVFVDYYQENIWVRIRWPAYPEHEPVRSILVSFRRAGPHSNKRRPCKRIELCVALSALITRFYTEVSAMEPHPAFAHLALGPKDDRISLYGLRMRRLRATVGAIFELELELDGTQPEKDKARDGGDDAVNDNDGESPGPEAGPSSPHAAPEDPVVRIHEAAWPVFLPVTCTVAEPPRITMNQYLAHVNPRMMSRHYLPTWQDPEP